MKIVCSVSVGNRLLPALSVNSNRKYVKSTLALCKHPKSSEYFIIHFSGNNKNGTKYNIKGNICQVLTRFLSEGKATIQFKEPQHDIYIQADSIQLKGFLQQLKLAIQNKVDEKEMRFSSLDVTPINQRSVAPKKLVIKSRSEYPVKGLPRTLETLHINDIHRTSIDRGIWQLTKLRILDISHNCITHLPSELKNMPCLKELNVSHNELGKATLQQWEWIGGYLSENLKLLNLSNNDLQYLPLHLSKLQALITLNVDNNRLKTLPFGVGRLQNLRILTASNNSLQFLPGSMKNLRLHDLDLSNNQFGIDLPFNRGHSLTEPLTICSLKEFAARKVLSMRVLYNPEVLPLTVCHYLDAAKYCVCGKACFNGCIKGNSILRLHSIADKVSISFDGVKVVPIECCFCSLKCYRNTIRHSIT